MTDIDYDELDKAVNSLANGNNLTNLPNNTSANVVPPTASVPNTMQPMTIQNGPVTPPSNGANTDSASIDNKQRSRGRFMDVVHPSSNMRSSISIPDRSTIPRQPVPTSPTPPAQPATPVMPTPNRWSNIAKTIEKPEVNNDLDDDADINRISEDIDKTLKESQDSPDSPFISDAKVEKRPLGAFSNQTSDLPVVETEKKDDLAVIDDKKDDIMTKPESDILSTATEKNDVPTVIENNNPPMVTSQDVSKTVPQLNSQKPAFTQPQTSTPLSSIASQPQPAVMNSIPQQYKEQPTTGGDSNNAIYDTDAYHKALVQPVKKKNGWLWVLWIFLLLIVGGGVGAAVYFFVLPNFL